MHDIWNPWHGCIKKSEGCENCYMYFLDKIRGQDGSRIRKVDSNFEYPLKKDKYGRFKIKSGEMIRVCMTSDFFLEQADKWRSGAWSVMRRRPDVIFFLLTKRPERVLKCLPYDWGDGWENIFFNITAENQKRADERIPILLDLPFKHKGIMCAPLIGEISIKKYLKDQKIEQVICGGENYDGARVCKYDWVRKIYEECVEENVRFCFIETGTNFEKDGKIYKIKNKTEQSRQAYKSGLQFEGKELNFKLKENIKKYNLFADLQNTDMYERKFYEWCEECGSRLICNGCVRCGKCGRC